MKLILKFFVIGLILGVLSIMLFGCKSVEKVRKGTITKPDGTVEIYEETLKDESFTLGGSEGNANKVLNFPLSNLNVSGVGL